MPLLARLSPVAEIAANGGVTVVIDKHGRSGLIRRFGTGLTIALAGTALLTGCAAGQHAATVEKVTMADGVNADKGTIGIRDAAVAAPSDSSYPAGTDAPLQLVVVNNGSSDDQLTGISTPGAGSVVLSPGGGLSASAIPTNPSATPSSSSSSSSAPAQSNPIPVPAGASVRIGYDSSGPSAILTGLTTAFFPAQSIPVTFTFASGTEISVTLAVKLTTGANKAPTLSTAPPEGNLPVG
jgi:copper(I)-binding protein